MLDSKSTNARSAPTRSKSVEFGGTQTATFDRNAPLPPIAPMEGVLQSEGPMISEMTALIVQANPYQSLSEPESEMMGMGQPQTPVSVLVDAQGNRGSTISDRMSGTGNDNMAVITKSYDHHYEPDNTTHAAPSVNASVSMAAP